MCLCYIYYTKIYSKVAICVNELTLTPLSTFDIQSKNLNLIRKPSENTFLGHIRHLFFSYFPKITLDHVRGGGGGGV